MPHFHLRDEFAKVVWHPNVILERYGEHGWRDAGFVLCRGLSNMEFCYIVPRLLRMVWL